MKRIIIALSIAALAVSCAKDAKVEVIADFTTNKDVYQIGEDVIVTNNSVVKNDILALCEWMYGNSDKMESVYKLELEGVSFAVPGTYTITLTAYAELGAGKDVCEKTIKVIEENDIPWAAFDCPATVRVGEDVVFEDKSQDSVGGIETWIWDIGGISSTYQSPRISFDEPRAGVEVTLTVVDAYGARDSVTKILDVTE